MLVEEGGRNVDGERTECCWPVGRCNLSSFIFKITAICEQSKHLDCRENCRSSQC